MKKSSDSLGQQIKRFARYLTRHRRFSSIVPPMYYQGMREEEFADISEHEFREWKKKIYESFRVSRRKQLFPSLRDLRAFQMYQRFQPMAHLIGKDCDFFGEHQLTKDPEFMWVMNMTRKYKPTSPVDTDKFSDSDLSSETEEEIYGRMLTVASRYDKMCMGKDHAGYKGSVHDCPEDDCRVLSVLKGLARDCEMVWEENVELDTTGGGEIFHHHAQRASSVQGYSPILQGTGPV